MAKLTLAHFEITADDVDGIAGFYAKLLGWKAEPAGFVENSTMPDGRRLIYMEDPAGNLFGLTQSPPK